MSKPKFADTGYRLPPRPLNGCMCQGGECESCNRVVEAWDEMKRVLTRMTYIQGLPKLRDMAYAALAQADKVSK